jgi:hypothetical protein
MTDHRLNLTSLRLAVLRELAAQGIDYASVLCRPLWLRPPGQANCPENMQIVIYRFDEAALDPRYKDRWHVESQIEQIEREMEEQS